MEFDWEIVKKEELLQDEYESMILEEIDDLEIENNHEFLSEALDNLKLVSRQKMLRAKRAVKSRKERF